MSLYKKSNPKEDLEKSLCGHHPMCTKCVPEDLDPHDEENCMICSPQGQRTFIHTVNINRVAPQTMVQYSTNTGTKCPDPNCAICVAKRREIQTKHSFVVSPTTQAYVCPDPNCAQCLIKNRTVR